MAISKVLFEQFRREVFSLLSADGNILEEDEDMLKVISKSDDPSAVLELAKGMKEEGNVLFKGGMFDEALEKYGYAGLIATSYEFTEDFRAEVFNLVITALLNSVACFNKLKEFKQAGLVCTIILDFDPKHVKALFRRAMAAIELGEKELAYWDLMQASMIDPQNKEIKTKLDQLQKQASQNAKKDEQEYSVPVGLGLGVPLVRKKVKDKQVIQSENVETSSIESMKVDKINEETVDDCVSCLSTESSNINFMEVSSRGSGMDEKEPSKISACSMKEVCAEEEADSSDLKNLYPAESMYRFANRRKADSVLSIRGRDYHKIREGKSLQYFNPSSGSFMTIRMVTSSNESPGINKESKKLSRMDVPMVATYNGMQIDIEKQLKDDGSTITQDVQIGDQSHECRSNDAIEEVAENSGVDTPMESNQPYMEVSTGFIQACDQSSSVSRRFRRTQHRAESRRRKIGRPHTLYGAGKRHAKRRSIFDGLSNGSFCRRSYAGRKKRNASLMPETYEKIRKKIRIEGCYSISSSVVGYVDSCLDVASVSEIESVYLSFGSCLSSVSGLPTPHEMASAKMNGG